MNRLLLERALGDDQGEVDRGDFGDFFGEESEDVRTRDFWPLYIKLKSSQTKNKILVHRLFYRLFSQEFLNQTLFLVSVIKK